MGGIDGLWLNAGFGIFEPNDQVDADSFDGQTNVNVRGPVLQMVSLLPNIADGGFVVVTASVSPYFDQAQGVVYASTKGAVCALTRSWEADLAGRNIRVNSITPGSIDTNFMDGLERRAERRVSGNDQATGVARPVGHIRKDGCGRPVPPVGSRVLCYGLAIYGRWRDDVPLGSGLIN